MRRAWPYIVLAIVAVVVAAGPIWSYLRHANIPMLEPAGPVGLEERGVMLMVAGLSSLVIVPVFFLLFFFAWRYRASAQSTDERHAPNWDHDNTAVEFSWWFVLCVQG